MMAVHCPVHEGTVLIWPSQLLGIHNSEHGIELTYRCHCGAQAIWHTGRGAAGSRLIVHGTEVAAPAAA